VALNNVLLGVFTDPDAGDQSGEYTVLINWGDGMGPTVGEVIGSNGLFEVLGSHTYANAGLYVPLVQIEWGDPSLTDILPGLVVVGLVPGAAAKELSGPKNVPGNSIYRYSVEFNPGIKAEDDAGNGLLFDWSVSDPNIQWYSPRAQRSEDGENVVSDYLDVRFPNKAEAVTISLKVKRDGKTLEEHELPVNIVEVTVKTPTDNAFVPGRVGQLPNQTGQFPIKGSATPVPLKFTAVGTSPFGGTNMNVRPTGVPPGLKWNALVTLTAPAVDPNAATSIVVGFIQHVKSDQEAVLFPTISKQLVLTMPAAPTDQGYLDAASTTPPWYRARAATPTTSGNNGMAQPIGSQDTPYAFFPVQYPGPGPVTYAKSVENLTKFTLDVAATTRDGRGWSYWQEATAGWSVNLSGDILKIDDKPPLGWNWNGPGIAKVVTPPEEWKDTVWKILPDRPSVPIQEDVKPPTANEAGKQGQFVPSDLPKK
jgi:hypothetical protein